MSGQLKKKSWINVNNLSRHASQGSGSLRRERQHAVLTQTSTSADRQRYKTGVVEINHECSSLGYSTVYLLYSLQ